MTQMNRAGQNSNVFPASLSRFNSFLLGFLLPWKALRLILSTPRLLVWSVIPVLLTGSIYVLLILKTQAAVLGFLGDYLVTHGMNPSGWAMTLAQIVIRISLLIVGAISFAFIATLVSVPFNDFLAEAAESAATPSLPAVHSGGFPWRLRLLAIDTAKTLAAMGVGIIAILVSWVPVINFLALLISLLLVCFQFISYPQSRRGQGVLTGTQFLFKYLYSSLGFGAAITALFAVPLVSCFFLPIAVVGGTLLFARASAKPPFPRLR
jgi:CysZ protein